MKNNRQIASALFLAAMACAAISAAPAIASGLSGHTLVTGRGRVRNVVVYLQNTEHPRPGFRTSIDQRNKTFIPHVLAVPVGATVDFPNNDSVLHNVFTYFQSTRFDLGEYPRGASRHRKFTQPGLVALLCNIHTDMSAYIMVVDSPYFVVSGKDGQFNLPDVPPGAYTLHAWHESGAVYSQPIVIGRAPGSLEIQLGRH